MKEMDTEADLKPVFAKHSAVLAYLARKYLWWESSEKAARYPTRVLAAAMNLGTLEDYQTMYQLFGRQVLCAVLHEAVPGWFSPKAWSFWHRLLELAAPGEQVPPPPERRVSGASPPRSP